MSKRPFTERRRVAGGVSRAEPAETGGPIRKYDSILLDFPMRLVLPAMRAELLKFQTLGSGLLVLGRRIIPVLALGALERNDIAGHFL